MATQKLNGAWHFATQIETKETCHSKFIANNFIKINLMRIDTDITTNAQKKNNHTNDLMKPKLNRNAE